MELIAYHCESTYITQFALYRTLNIRIHMYVYKMVDLINYIPMYMYIRILYNVSYVCS